MNFVIPKILIVGNGPSKKNLDLIRDFEGNIIAVDSVTQELIDNGIMPDYVTWLEVSWVEVQHLILSLLPNLKNSILVHRWEECKYVYKEASKYVLCS